MKFLAALAVVLGVQHQGAVATARVEAPSMPSAYVRVPGGYMHPACVHAVPQGAALVQADLAPCPHAFLRTHPRQPSAHGSAWKAWAQYSSADASAAVTALNSTWRVPDEPQETGDGQVLFWWNGVEPLDTSAVLQPVVQWGPSAAGGGAYWAYASWYVSATHGSHFSPLIQIAAGDLVLGTNARSADGTWRIAATAQGRAPSVLTFAPVDSGAAWGTAYHVLEAYGVSTGCSAYPAAGSVNFTGVALEVGGSRVSPIPWELLVQNAGCGERATASARGDKVTILFDTA